MQYHALPSLLPNTMRQIAEIFHYHAHVYYDDSNRTLALQLRDQIAERFAVQVGRLFEQAVGPHPIAQYEIGFYADEFARLVPWLMLNRQDLVVMIHPNTDRERDDHAHAAMWLGEPLPLLLDKLDVSLLATGQAEPRAVVINSEIKISI